MPAPIVSTSPSATPVKILRLCSCSLDCYKAHKLVHTQQGKQLPPPPDNISIPLSLFVSEALKKNGNEPAQDAYTTLLRSAKLEQLFAGHPQLKSQLKSIYGATLEPSQEDQESEARRRKRVSRGRGRGRGRGNVHNSPAPWTRERGLKDAMRQLKKVRRGKGQEDEGMREFSALVTKIHEAIAPSTQDRDMVVELPPLEFLEGAV
ncbi:hypothetical protein MMC18_005296 [Xylographa bjoerkii]|nr:hypothetical protein [Xylographa bjoerkii]